MPYSYRIDTTYKVVLFKAVGLFTSDNLLRCLKEIVADPNFRPTFNHFVDLREVSDFQVSWFDMEKKADADFKMRSQIGEGRIALLSSSDIVYGMTRIYEIMMEDSQTVVRTFKNINSAIKWLGIPDAITKWE